jgi:hypothetical protein
MKNELRACWLDPQQSWDPKASLSTNHERCHPLLNGLKAGVGSQSILE